MDVYRGGRLSGVISGVQVLAVAVAVSLLLVMGAQLHAVELDISGSWQFNNGCGTSNNTEVIQVRVMDISENVETGVVSTTTSDCGTLVLDGGIHEYASCSLAPVAGQVTGTSVSIPTSGFSVDDAWFQTPFPSATFGCINPPLARYVAQSRMVATITDHGAGRGTRISGQEEFWLVQAFDSGDTLCGSFNLGGTPQCGFVMLRNEVPVGTDVTVEPLDGATVTFSEVTSGGGVTITPLTEPDGTVPAEFQLFDLPIFFDVTTDVTFTGAITVCVPYQDDDNDGFVDNSTPPIDENLLQILHEETGEFVDRTVSRDPVNNQICAEVSSVAQFVVGAERLDHFKCYKTKDLKQPKFVKTTVNLADQFGVNDGGFELKKPFLLCNPVDKNGEGIVNEHDYLTCYKMKEARELGGADKHFIRPTVVVENQLGSSTLQPKKAFLLCVPTDRYVCGDGDLDPGEECDGSDDQVCPGQCGLDCVCLPPLCPESGAELPTACEATGFVSACAECCSAFPYGCELHCDAARNQACTSEPVNTQCAVSVNVLGCANVCCP